MEKHITKFNRMTEPKVHYKTSKKISAGTGEPLIILSVLCDPSLWYNPKTKSRTDKKLVTCLRCKKRLDKS